MKTGTSKYDTMTREQLLKAIREKDVAMEKFSTKPTKSAYRGAVKNFSIMVISALNPIDQLERSRDNLSQIISEELTRGCP